MKQYENLASIYDRMIDVNYDEWLNFIEEYLRRKEIILKGKKTLELGCGTGNMTLRLRPRGMEITALDISDDMLTLAQEKAFKKRFKINFLNQDMVDFELNRKFDLIFSFCDGYNYITDEESLANSFHKVFTHLNNQGVFMFDISTQHKLKDIIGGNTFTMNDEKLCYIWDNYYEKDILEMYITFFVPEGKLYKRIDETHVQRAYSVETLIKLLHKTGFSRVEVLEDYSFNALKDESIRATFIVEK
ncbi:MAG: class SAM-dependent methyltransferase [Clostridiales bacterium]|jgi:ubiquinone/menaquinone biosynthesis C-methylase UbiE|nr:class SAM-dependent methyltransferase [Clostridiales bacterium]